jgi:hypothetical protein
MGDRYRLGAAIRHGFRNPQASNMPDRVSGSVPVSGSSMLNDEGRETLRIKPLPVSSCQLNYSHYHSRRCLSPCLL